MQTLASWTMEQFTVYALMLVRVSVLFLSAPILGNVNIPAQVKAAMAMVITLVLYLALKGGHQALAVPGNVFELVGAVGGEAFAGLIIGYTAFLLFSGLEMAGEIVDIQVGFGLVNVIDPAGGSQVSIIGQFYYIVAMLFFLAIDGHHALLKALGDSFTLLPPGTIVWFKQAGHAGPLLAQFFTRLFAIAIQIAAPSIAVLFLTNLSMGLLARTLPQMNVFIVGMPLNVIVGLLITIVSLKLLGVVLTGVTSQVGASAFRMLSALTG
jgi:flagellar biosynthetic protein FliR